MFSAMGNCVSCIKRRRQPKRQLTLAILGVDNAGKSTIVNGLKGDSLETTPTVGYNDEQITIANCDITIFDLGGGKKIRDIWTQYLPELYGIIYVVDSADVDRMEEVKHNLQILLGNEKVKGKPLLLLVNKQDLGNALDEVDICEQLNLENTVNINKCPCRIETCVAIKGTGRKMDPNIKLGIKWLCGIVEHNWEKYNTRVEKDMEEEKARKKIELEERRERVRKQREERERKEREENERLGIKNEDEEEVEEDFANGGPFKRLNINELAKKELKSKELKKRRKMLEQQNQERDNDDEEDDGLGRRSFRSSNKHGLRNGGFTSENKTNNADSDEEEEDDDDDDLFSRRVHKLTPRLPPLQKPLGTRTQEETFDGVKKLKRKKKKPKLKPVDEFENEQSGDNEDNFMESKKSMRSISNLEFDGFGRRGYQLNALDDTNEEEPIQKSKKKKSRKKKNRSSNFDDGYGMDLTTPRSLKFERNGDLENSYNENRRNGNYNSDSEEEAQVSKKSKTKKSYLKKNKTAPSDDESEVPRYPANRDFSWTMSPRKGIEMDVRNSRQDSDDDDDDRDVIRVSSSRKWQLAEDLGDVEDTTTPSSRRHISNVDDDDDIVY